MSEKENEFEFKNLETGQNIKLNFDKQFIVIYGKNGCGKTTLSRSDKFKKKFVFNSDFINKNVYIVGSEGAKDDKNTKEGFSSLWFSEKIISIKKEYDNLKNFEKQIESNLAEINKNIIEKSTSLGFSVNMGDYINQLDTLRISIPKDNKWTDDLVKYKCPISFKSSIKNDDEAKIKIISYQNSVAKESFLKDINLSKFLKSIFIDKVSSEIEHFKILVNKFDIDREEIISCEKAFIAKDKVLEKEWINTALKLHKDIDQCLFCNNRDIKKSKDDWLGVVSSKANQSKNNLESFIRNIINETKPIYDKKEEYGKIFPHTTKAIVKIHIRFNEFFKQLNSNKNINIGDDLFNFDDEKLLKNENDIRNDISNYIVKDFIDSFVYLYLLRIEYSNAAKTQQEALDKEMNDNAESISISINGRLAKLNFDKELSVRVDSRSDKKYAFSFKNKSVTVGTLSDGQKHKLALAIFLESISNQDLTNETVVIDDPVITLDFRTYYAVKEQIKDLTKNKNVKHLILLTHNVTFLYLQISDFFNKKDIDAKMYRLFGNTAQEVDINLINYEDITLYKKSLDLISNSYEFNLVANMNLRIFRYFLDLRSRIEGISDSGNPVDSICNYNLGETIKKRLHKINSELTSILRGKNSDNNELLNSFVLLKESVSLLGFPEVINDSTISDLSKFGDDKIRTSEGVASEFIFDILAWIYELFNNSSLEYKSIQDYMNHPRLQLTKTLVGLDLSDNDGNFSVK